MGSTANSGVYSTAYTLGTTASSTGGHSLAIAGNITIVVGKNNTLTITVVDNVSGTFVGSGKLRANESFSISCTDGTGNTVTIEGSIAKSQLSKNAVGKAKGAITFSYDAPICVNTVAASLWANTYTGTIDMKNLDSYNFTAVVDTNGFIKMNFPIDGKDVNLFGLVFSDGRVILAPAEGEKEKFFIRGNIYLFSDLKDLYIREMYPRQRTEKPLVYVTVLPHILAVSETTDDMSGKRY